MLTNSPLGFGKCLTALLIILAFSSGCTKSYDPGDLLGDRNALLTGKPGTVSWILSTIQVNNSVDNSVKGARKVYRSDGTFVDELGFTGYWTLTSRDELVESTRSSVNPDAPYTTNHYHIDFLDAGSLQLTYTEENKRIRFVYDANK